MNWKKFIEWLIDFLNQIFSPPIPNPPPPPPPPPPSVEEMLLKLHNDWRTSKGIDALTLNDKLNVAAQKHTLWMYDNNTLDHFENGKSPGDRIRAEGYNWIAYGENIAEGYDTPEAVFNGWINSAGHKANIERSTYKDVGFGKVGKFWTAVFATAAGFGMDDWCPVGLKEENHESHI